MSCPRTAAIRACLLAACCTLAVGLAGLSRAADISGCLKLEVKPNGDAVLANGCAERINVSYCVDRPESTRSCATKAKDIVTLFPGAADTLSGYAAQGGGPVYWAACIYPEAAVGWEPGPDNPYTCKKTCVMC
jgi:hypothetical protein